MLKYLYHPLNHCRHRLTRHPPIPTAIFLAGYSQVTGTFSPLSAALTHSSPRLVSVGMEMAHRLVTCWRRHLLCTPLTHLQMVANWHPAILYPNVQPRSTPSNLYIGHPTYVGQPISAKRPAYAHLAQAAGSKLTA